MVVTVVLSGVPQHVNLIDLGCRMDKVFDSDEIGTFRVRDLPLGPYTTKRHVAIDFDSGFDAMSAQEQLDGFNYVLDDGMICTFHAKVKGSSPSRLSSKNSRSPSPHSEHYVYRANVVESDSNRSRSHKSRSTERRSRERTRSPSYDNNEHHQRSPTAGSLRLSPVELPKARSRSRECSDRYDSRVDRSNKTKRSKLDFEQPSTSKLKKQSHESKEDMMKVEEVKQEIEKDMENVLQNNFQIKEYDRSLAITKIRELLDKRFERIIQNVSINSMTINEMRKYYRSRYSKEGDKSLIQRILIKTVLDYVVKDNESDVVKLDRSSTENSTPALRLVDKEDEDKIWDDIAEEMAELDELLIDIKQNSEFVSNDKETGDESSKMKLPKPLVKTISKHPMFFSPIIKLQRQMKNPQLQSCNIPEVSGDVNKQKREQADKTEEESKLEDNVAENNIKDQELPDYKMLKI